MESEPTQLRFGPAEVEAFARASGDRNPLHLDPEFAVDTAFGGPVVHGALVAMAMLGVLPDEALTRVQSVRVLFPAPVRVGERLEVSSLSSDRGWEVRATLRGKVAVRVLARAEPQPAREHPPAIADATAGARPEPAAPDPARLRPGFRIGGEYELSPGLATLAQGYGAGALNPALLAGLAWSSYVVGMEIPGRHSLFAGVTLSLGAQLEPSGFSVTVREHDERTGQVVLAGSVAACQATIECFALPATRRPEPAALLPREPPDRSRGEVLVVGCSRGFGAALALALLARGYDVHGTYRSSPRRASALTALAGELPAPAGRLTLTRCDAADPAALAALAEGRERDGAPRLAGLVLNAALPPLGMGLTADAGPDLAQYVAQSVSLAAVPLGAMLGQLDEQGGFVLVCSSAAVSAPPREWPHYVAAKAALEGLGRWVAASRPTLRTVIVRLPKMDTAMTATPSGRLGAASADAVAAWTAEQLSGAELTSPLAMLEPKLEAVPA